MPTLTEPLIICPSCESRDLTLLGRLRDNGWFAGQRLAKTLPGGQLYRCTQCALKFRFPVLSDGEYARLYNNNSCETWADIRNRRDWDLITKHVNQQLPRGGKILDFGCYTGGLLQQLGTSYDLYGVEVNRAAAAVAADKTGVKIYTDATEIPAGLRFDAVIASDVIEHMRDPVQFLALLSSLATDDGIILITTGNAECPLWNSYGANWWYCFYPEHLVFISKSWTDFVARRLELRIASCQEFAYADLPAFRRLITKAAVYWFGKHPPSYIGVASTIRTFRKSRASISIPGNGICEDHLFVVFRKGQAT